MHVRVTLEWLLQLQPTFFFFFFFFFADSAVGPNGPGRLQAGRQARRQGRRSSKHSFHSRSIRELNMRYDCRSYVPVFLKRSWTSLGSNV